MELKWLSGEYTEVVDFYSNLSTAPIGRFNYLFTEKEQKRKKQENEPKALLFGAHVRDICRWMCEK